MNKALEELRKQTAIALTSPEGPGWRWGNVPGPSAVQLAFDEIDRLTKKLEQVSEVIWYP